jgi:inner membrane protein involved in colicin E2 resistance
MGQQQVPMPDEKESELAANKILNSLFLQHTTRPSNTSVGFTHSLSTLIGLLWSRSG